MSFIFSSNVVAHVAGFTFNVLHRMEGCWNGDVSVIGKKGAVSDVNVCTVLLTFDATASVWRERQTFTTKDGLSSVKQFVLGPIANGLLRVEGDDFKACDIRLEERSNNLIVLTAVSHEKGLPVVIETITLMDDMRRTRTTQVFNETTGEFEALYLMKENRVIDSVTGAIMTT